MIPGWLISILTFPGVVVHEWGHKKFCEWLKVPVYEVVYFQFGNPAGYVLHGETTNYKQTFWVSVGPLVVNSLSTIFIASVALLMPQDGVLMLTLLWVAVSVGMHSFPSNHDMTHILEDSKRALKNSGSPLHYLAFPFVGLIYLANLLKFFWWDFVYAIILIMIGASLVGYY